MMRPEGLESKFMVFILLQFLLSAFSIVNVGSTRLGVVNGNGASPDSFKFMVTINTTINDLPVLCGGTLIHEQLVLTAAKCLYGAEDAKVTLGVHNLAKPEKTKQTFLVKKDWFLIHEKYNHTHIRHDIAVLVLDQPVKLNDNVALIKIPKMDDITKTYDEMLGIIVGWGKASDTATGYSSILQYAEVVIIPLASCEIIHILDVLGLDQMCTSGTSKINICLGDNGGPLMVDDVQVGIASFGSDIGCEIGFPGIYTRLTSYLNWLNHTVAELSLEKPFLLC